MRSDLGFSKNFASSSCPADFLTIELPIRLPEQPRKRRRGDDSFASRLGGLCVYQVMTSLPRFLTPLVAGCAVTFLQVIMAVALLAPEKPITERYSALVQHDSYWFMNILDRGYQTIVPPIDHKVMEVSNVAFFPGYPVIAAMVRNAFNISPATALLISAQLAAWGFWTYFFLFCRRWKVAPSLQICGTLLILANPAAFFLVAAYSESLFLMALLGFIYWSTAEGRAARVLAAMHGVIMSATRIVGIVCAAFPLVRSAFQTGWRGLLEPLKWLRDNRAAVGLTFVAACGGVALFFFWQLRLGHWGLFLLPPAAGWGIRPAYFCVGWNASLTWACSAPDKST